MPVDKIKKMVEDGFATRKIARMLFLDYEKVKELIKQMNWGPTSETFNVSEIERIMNIYKEGVSAKALGLKFNIRKSRVQKWAEDRGILRDSRDANRLKIVNQNIFDKIDTEQKAYWLGFLYADAYNCELISCLRLGLKDTDVDHLRKYCVFMGGEERDITFRELENEYKGEMRKYYSCNYNINSKHLCEQLSKLGCMQGKSLILKYPEWLDPKLNFHFIRGYFDGDGCISSGKRDEHRWRLAGTKEVCESIKNIFLKEGIEIKYKQMRQKPKKELEIIEDEVLKEKKLKNTYEMCASGNLKVEKIMNLLYKNSTVCLTRKYDLYVLLRDMNAKRHNKDTIKYSSHLKVGDFILNDDNIKKLSKEERAALITPIVEQILKIGFISAESYHPISKNFNKLRRLEIDTNIMTLDNQSKLCVDICKYFCPSFYSSRSREDKSLYDSFSDKDMLVKAVSHRLGLFKYAPENNSISIQTIQRAMKDKRLCAHISIFKPEIAKYMYLKYSNEGDTVGDYSCGFGGRLLGAMSCGRKYVGTDPLTVPELLEMVDYLNFEDRCILEATGSESYRGQPENSIDLYWSSPPYYDLEIYSESPSQANSKGENYFYNTYWRKTLENIKYMLKPGKWFGVNVNIKYYKMVEIAKEYFGELVEQVDLKSMRYHYSKDKREKHEYIYMFKNNK